MSLPHVQDYSLRVRPTDQLPFEKIDGFWSNLAGSTRLRRSGLHPSRSSPPARGTAAARGSRASSYEPFRMLW